MEEELGLTLDDLLTIPKGEFTFAIAAPPGGRPAAILLVEVGPDPRHVKTLIERGEEALREEGRTRSTEKIGSTELIMFEGTDEDPVLYAIRDEVLMIASNQELAQTLLATWDGNPPEVEADEPATLAENSKYATIMNRCGGGKERKPHATFYLDPISLVRASFRGNFSAQAGLAMLPVIGLDGLQGLGGSMLMNDDEFDSVLHGHLLLDNPRNGVLEVIALKSGSTTPESWVPRDAASYMTSNWDFSQMRTTIASLYDSFRGDDAFKNQVLGPANDWLEIDFDDQLIGTLDGRVTMFTWIEKPVTISSQASLLGLKLKDKSEFRATFLKLLEKGDAEVEKQFFAGTEYWQLPQVDFDRGRVDVEVELDGDDEENVRRARLRPQAPQPCFAITGDYFLAANRPNILRAALTAKSDGDNSLAKELDFKLINSRIKRQIGEAAPGAITFNRPEEGFRMMYDLLKSEGVQGELSRRAETEDFFKSVQGVMQENPLPPFSVIAQYLAPGGGVVTNDETGFHYTAFGLKRKK